MSRYGLPDYGMYAALENMGNLVDYGELAARLKSISTFNREGNVVFWDDFESTPLKWAVFFEGGTGTVGLTDEAALSGGQCVKATCYPTINRRAGIIRYFLLVSEGLIGAEFAFSTEETTQYIYFHLSYDTGIYIYNATFRLSVGAETLEIIDENLGWVTIATGVELMLDKQLFHHVKIVVDLKEKKYKRLILDRDEFNVEQYDMSIYWYSDGKAIRAKIYNNALENVAKTFYIDNFILTQNEP